MTGKELLKELQKERYDAKGLDVGYWLDGEWIELTGVTREGENIILSFAEEAIYGDPEETDVPAMPDEA